MTCRLTDAFNFGQLDHLHEKAPTSSGVAMRDYIVLTAGPVIP